MYNYEYNRDMDNRILVAIENELSIKKHFHNCFEIIYVIDGEALVHIDDNTYKLSSGQFCAVASFSSHYYETLKRGNYIVSLIPRIYFREYDHLFNTQAFKNPVLDDDSVRGVLSTLQIMLNLYVSQSAKEKTPTKYKKDQIQLLGTFIVSLCIDRCGLHDRKRISSLVANAVFLIESDFKKDISIELICKKLGCSQNVLAYNFKKTMNMSILDYINRTRVFEAAKLLKKYPDATIEAIMIESGFNSNRSFLRHFRSYFSCTPTEYKNTIN